MANEHYELSNEFGVDIYKLRPKNSWFEVFYLDSKWVVKEVDELPEKEDLSMFKKDLSDAIGECRRLNSMKNFDGVAKIKYTAPP